MIPAQLAPAMIILRCFDPDAQFPYTDGFLTPGRETGLRRGPTDPIDVKIYVKWITLDGGFPKMEVPQ